MRIPSLREAVLFSIKNWDRTMPDRANQANESSCQPQSIPYEIHGFRLAKLPNDGTSGPWEISRGSILALFLALFPLEFLVHAQCELRRLGFHLLNCCWSFISKYSKIDEMNDFCARRQECSMTCWAVSHDLNQKTLAYGRFREAEILHGHAGSHFRPR